MNKPRMLQSLSQVYFNISQLRSICYMDRLLFSMAALLLLQTFLFFTVVVSPDDDRSWSFPSERTLSALYHGPFRISHKQTHFYSRLRWVAEHPSLQEISLLISHFCLNHGTPLCDIYFSLLVKVSRI